MDSTGSFITPEQAAERLQVSPRTVKRLCEAGRLDAIDVGTAGKRRWRIPAAALDVILPRGPLLRRNEEPRGNARPRPYKHRFIQPN